MTANKQDFIEVLEQLPASKIKDLVLRMEVNSALSANFELAITRKQLIASLSRKGSREVKSIVFSYVNVDRVLIIEGFYNTKSNNTKEDVQSRFNL